ncbi:hypothetical protein DFJ74DRAFT_26844 [Hyaloraphidium curvatum]|nr:hypothetical protein DFJ74DRAFT_26844 [Hyaloraphidium curvatum]
MRCVRGVAADGVGRGRPGSSQYPSNCFKNIRSGRRRWRSPPVPRRRRRTRKSPKWRPPRVEASGPRRATESHPPRGNRQCGHSDARREGGVAREGPTAARVAPTRVNKARRRASQRDSDRPSPGQPALRTDGTLLFWATARASRNDRRVGRGSEGSSPARRTPLRRLSSRAVRSFETGLRLYLMVFKTDCAVRTLRQPAFGFVAVWHPRSAADGMRTVDLHAIRQRCSARVLLRRR